MPQMPDANRLPKIMAWWFVAVILGLTVALLAVGLLGLWVAFGALAGLGTTLVSGWLFQVLFCTDFDKIIAERQKK